MRTLMAVISVCVFVLTGEIASAAKTPPEALPILRLNDFRKFEVTPTVFLGTSGSGHTDMFADRLSKQIDNVMQSKANRWNADVVLRGKLTLLIQPQIMELRTGKDVVLLPRKSRFTLRLRLMNKQSGEVVSEPEFSENANALAATFTRGRADDDMLTHVLKAASAYLDSAYETAAAEATRERDELVAQQTAAAGRGDAFAQLALGNMYSAGQDVAQNDAEAIVWWDKAATQGNIDAQLSLGWAYANGRGTKQDDNVAVAWWREAAEHGNAQGQLKLGWMYQNGRGVARSEADALAWYRKAANQGDTTAKIYVARAERGTRRFSSFDDARTALNPEDGLDGVLMTNPMFLKGRIFAVRLEVVQVIGNGRMLMTSPYLGVSQLDGKIYYAEIPPTYAGSREFVDGQQVAAIGEVTGSQQYTTAVGTAKTVPKIIVYGIRAEL